MANGRVCSIPDCGKKHKAKGFCATHHRLFRRTGSPVSRYTAYGAPLKWLMANVAHQGDACLIWPFARPPNVRPHVRVDGAYLFASRVICEAAHGPPPDSKSEAAHSCGRGHDGCMNPRHLRWATPSENRHEMFLHGATWTKLNVADVRAIRSMKDKIGQRQLAEQYGVARSVISRIMTGRRWGWLAQEE